MSIRDVQAIYICWPFTASSSISEIATYSQVLQQEIQNTFVSEKPHIRSVFIGGGDGLSIPSQVLLDTSCILRNVIHFSPGYEFSIEINPGEVSQKQIDLWKEVGINRISLRLNPKEASLISDKNALLQQDVYSLLTTISKDITNISIDLLYGLPGITSDTWKETIISIVSWPITHLSIYFYDPSEDGDLDGEIMDENTFVSLYEWTSAYLDFHGLSQYELSNFARPGCISQQNEMYWDQKPYKGCGIGAVSYDGEKRIKNTNSLEYYRRGGEDSSIEYITPELRFTELLMLGLRRKKGVCKDELFKQIPSQHKNEIINNMQQCVDNGLIIEKENKLFFSLAGMMLENEIIKKLSLL